MITTEDLNFRAEKCRQIIINNLIDDYDVSEYHKQILREEFYHWIYFSSEFYDGIMSNAAFDMKDKSKCTNDHFMTPRLFISAMCENKREILYDSEQFKNMFCLCTTVVKVSPKQNNSVRYKNLNGKIIVSEPILEKYDKLGPWWKVRNKKILGSYTEFPLKNKIPDWFVDYEKKFVK